MPASSFFDYSDKETDSRDPGSYDFWKNKADSNSKSTTKERPPWQQAAFDSLMSKTYGTDKWQSYAQNRRDDRPYFSEGGGGGVREAFPGFAIYEPKQQPISVIPGVEGSSGGGSLFSDIGSAAGLLGTVAGVFGPLGAPIGALAGKFIDRAVG